MQCNNFLFLAQHCAPPKALTSPRRILSKSPSPSRLAIPNIASPRSSKSPSPSHLAIISGFIEDRRQREKEDREKTPINMAEPIHQTVRESVEKTRENAVVNNIEIKSAKVKTLVQNSAATSKNMEKKDQINDEEHGKQDFISIESKIVTQDEPIIVVNQVDEKKSISTSHCWSSGNKKRIEICN